MSYLMLCKWISSILEYHVILTSSLNKKKNVKRKNMYCFPINHVLLRSVANVEIEITFVTESP